MAVTVLAQLVCEVGTRLKGGCSRIEIVPIESHLRYDLDAVQREKWRRAILCVSLSAARTHSTKHRPRKRVVSVLLGGQNRRVTE